MSNAHYNEQWVPEYRGNPLIEALPSKLPDSEMLLKLANTMQIESDETVTKTV
jgi:hypothetical protein